VTRSVSILNSAGGCPGPHPGRAPIGLSLSLAHSPAGGWALGPAGMLQEREQMEPALQGTQGPAAVLPQPPKSSGHPGECGLARQVNRSQRVVSWSCAVISGG
jgi:hypothetical protein